MNNDMQNLINKVRINGQKEARRRSDLLFKKYRENPKPYLEQIGIDSEELSQEQLVNRLTYEKIVQRSLLKLRRCMSNNYEVANTALIVETEKLIESQEQMNMSFWNKDLTKIPYDEIVLFITDAGHVYQDFVYDQSTSEYVQRSKEWGNGREVKAWAHVPPLETQ